MTYLKLKEMIISSIETILKDEEIQQNMQTIEYKPSNDFLMCIEKSITQTIYTGLTKHIDLLNLEYTILFKRIKQGFKYTISGTTDIDNEEIEPDNFGTMTFSYTLTSKEMNLTIYFKNDDEKETYLFPITNILKKLDVVGTSKEIDPILKEVDKLIIIDFEWLSSYDKNQKIYQLVSEYGLISNNDFYYSNSLKIEKYVIKKTQKILLKQMNTTKNELLIKHNTGNSMLLEYQKVIIPIMQQQLQKNKKIRFVSFGSNDHVILKELIGAQYKKHVHYYDFREIYFVEAGQQNLLTGIGVKFNHTFNAGDDAKGLALLINIFNETTSYREAKLLESLILMNKKIIKSNTNEKTIFYMNLLLKDDNLYQLWEKRKKHIIQSGFELAN